MIKTKLFFLFILIVFFSIFVNFSFALEELSKEKMKTTTGQISFSDFTTTNTTTRIFLNTHIETFTEIESIKLGYYAKEGANGWDQNWTNISIGTNTANLTIDGLIIKADFDDLNSANPTLKRLIIGSNMLNGNISGNFNSFTGTFHPALEGGNSPPLEYSRENLGSKNFSFDSSSERQGFFLILNPQAGNQGIHSVLGFSEGNIQNAFAPNHWWDQP
ncbi:MAG: hypothetical protein RBR53_01135 [Desulforegulaceae bacterium]|nr:hypothetical protein [Desulforegulaceae bacterium]